MPPEVVQLSDQVPMVDILESAKNQDVNPLDSAMRECMLDTFPLNESELQHVLRCYYNFQSELSTFSSMCQTMHEPEYTDRLLNVEATFLPEANAILGQALSDAFVIGTGHDDSEQFKFLEAIVTLLGRRGARSLFQIIYKVSETTTAENPVQAVDLVNLVHRLLLASEYLKTSQPEKSQSAPQSWIISLQERCRGNEKVELPVWIDWVNSIAPQVYQALSTFAHYAIFTPAHPFRSTCPPLMLPETDQECALWKYSYQTVPLSLAMLSPNLGGKWTRQYSSDSDGFSFATFQNALIGYQGATVILLQTVAGDAFGFYTDCPWKESKNWYGQEADSFLFGLKPSLQFYGPGGGKPYNMHLRNPVSPRPGELTGLAIGGISDTAPRLHVTTTFEQCKAGAMDGVYASGPLLSNDEVFFDLDVIEIWAVNASEEEYTKSLQAGTAQSDIREGNRIKMAQVDRKQFLEDFQSGQYSNTLYAHRDQARGRHDFHADENGRGYFLEDYPPTPKEQHSKHST